MKSPQLMRSQSNKISNYKRISKNKMTNQYPEFSSKRGILNENDDVYEKRYCNNKIGSILMPKCNPLLKCNVPQKARELNNSNVKSTRKSYRLENNTKLKSIITAKQSKNPEGSQRNFFLIKNKSYKKSKNHNYNKDSICLYRAKNSVVKLISEKKYLEKGNEQNKAIFYKDICVTGHKIAIWKKLKNNISSLTSTVTDFKIKEPDPKQLNIKNHQCEESICDAIKKTKSKPFRQIFWNLYCKCSFSKTKNCPILPLIQFPDTPDHCLYKKCSCILHGENKYAFHKLNYSHSGKISPNIRASEVTIDKSKILINVKSSSTKINTSCKELKSTCTETQTLVKKQIDNIILDKHKKEVCPKKFDSKTCQVKYNDVHTEVGGDFILHDRSAQYLNVPNKIKCTKEPLIECRCKNTPKDEEIGCGDQINNLTIKEHQNNIPLLQKNKDCKYNQVKMFFRSFKQINTRSNLCKNHEKETHHTQIFADDILITRKNKFRKSNRKLRNSIGIQCNFSLKECRNLKKFQKKISVKEKVCNKSCLYEVPVPRLKTMGNQCNLIKQPICKSTEQKNYTNSHKKNRNCKTSIEACECNNLMTFINCKPTRNIYDICKPCKKYYSMKNPLFTTIGTQCSIISKSISKFSNTTGKKSWSRKISTNKTECAIVNSRSCNTKNTSCKESYFFKLALCNSIGIQCCLVKPKICTCTKYLYNSKSCDNICCRKLPIPCSSVETQRNSIYFHQAPKRLRLKNKQYWSPFSLKTPKSGRACCCVRSLMCIDDTYKNYYVNPALLSRCKQSKIQYKENFCYYGRDRGDFSNNIKFKTASKPHCCITKEVKNKCTNALPCRRKYRQATCRCKRKNNACFLESYPINYSKAPRYQWPMYPKSRCEHCYSSYFKSMPCRHSKKNKKQARCKSHKILRPYCSDSCRMKTRCRCCYIKKVIQLLICFGQNSCVCRRTCKKPTYKYDCNKIFMNTLRRARCQCIYRLCPWAYPECLNCLGLCRQNVQCILVITTWIVWCPFIVFMELFRFCFCYLCYD